MAKTEIVKSDQQAMPPSEQLLELAQANAMVVKTENDAMSSIAVSRPRDLISIRRSAEQELEVFPEQAAGAWYSIPYWDAQKGKNVFVEGPSVKTARRLAQKFGNCSIDTRIIEVGEDHATVQGVALDLETNYRFAAPPIRVSRHEKRKGGRIVRLDDDRFNIKIRAAMSKALRNALFGIIPDSFVEMYVAKAKEIATKDVTRDPGKRGRPSKKDTRSRILEAFSKWPEISEDNLCVLAGVDTLEDITDDQKQDLVGLLNALKAGDIDPQEIVRRAAEAVFQQDKPDPFAPTDEGEEAEDSASMEERD